MRADIVSKTENKLEDGEVQQPQGMRSRRTAAKNALKKISEWMLTPPPPLEDIMEKYSVAI